MSKIATYSLADSPLQLSDRLIGTEAPRPTPSATPLATKNFSLGELLQLFSSNFPAPGLQGVLDTSNTATQDINLSGTIFVDLIKPTNIEDMLNSIGTPLQILSKGVGGICWIDAPSTGSAIWGDITGDITDQTDLINYLSEEYYPLNSNPAGYLTSASLSGYVPYVGATEALNIGEYSFNAQSALGDYISLDGTQLYLFNASLGSTMIIDGSQIFVFDSVGTSSLSTSSLGLNGATISYSALFSGDNFLLPNKLGAGGTFAMLSDIPSYIIPTLQEVLTEGNTATDLNIKLEDSIYNTYTEFTGFYTRIKEIGTNNNIFYYGGHGNFVVWDGINPDYIQQLSFDPLGAEAQNFFIPSKPTGNYTLATLDDIPTSSGIPHGTASGTDTYTATITGVTAYADGDAYLIRFTNGNTTGATLNINGIGAVALYRNNDGPLLGGDILDGGEMICVYNSTTTVFQCIGTSPNSLYAYVKNDDSVTLTKGMPVYAFSGTGDRMTVKRANNTGDATSAQTVGLVMSSSIAAGQKGLIMVQGLLDGLSILPTSTWTDGDPVYLGATDGSITNVKPYAPNHLVYLGVVTTASNGSAGRMYVRVQNGYELQELHNVQITSTPTNNDVLTYEASSSLYKMKSLGTILGYNSYRYVNATRATYLASVIGVAEYTVAQTTIIGGTFSTTDVMKMLTRFSKPAGAGTVTLRVRINTTNTLVGATQIALLTLAAANTTSLLTRTFNLSGATLYGYNFASSLALDLIATNTVQSSTAYTTTNDLYVFFTVQIANAADSVTFELANITN